MEKNINAQNAERYAKMTDAELSKKLGSYQKQARIWILVGLAGAIGGMVSYFAVQNTALKAVLTAVLFFGGVGCAVFLGGGAQKKIKQLMQSEMGDFFKAEFTKAFGEEAHNAKMNIDEKLMKKLSLFEGQWEECETESFHEGEYRKVRFSAANVRLNHVYERGNVRESLETCRQMVFKGLVIRCETRPFAVLPVCANARTEESKGGILTGDGALDRCYVFTSDSEGSVHMLATPRFSEMIQDFLKEVEGNLIGFLFEDDTLTLAIETDYGFASVASSVDLRDIEAVRRSYIKSLSEMKGTLDILFKNNEMFSCE